MSYAIGISIGLSSSYISGGVVVVVFRNSLNFTKSKNSQYKGASLV